MRQPAKIEGWNIRVRSAGVGCHIEAEAWGADPECKDRNRRSVTICDMQLQTPLSAAESLKFVADAIERAEANNYVELARWKERQS